MEQLDYPVLETWEERRRWFEALEAERGKGGAASALSEQACALMVDLQATYCAGAFAAAIVLAATIVDNQGRFARADPGLAEELGWLRLTRNADDAEDVVAEAVGRMEAGEKLDDGVALAGGLLAIEAEDFDRVEPLMKLALENGLPSKTAIVSNWGLGMLIADQNEQAAEVLESAIDDKIDPDNEAAFYYYLASALGMSDRFEEAVVAAQKAAELRPTARFRSRIAWLHYYAGKYDSAVEQYEKILEEFADEYGDADTREVVSDIRSVLSAIAVKQERIDEAVEYLERVLDEFPEDVGAHNDLGYLWADENVHLQRAHAMITYAVTEEPENKAYRDSLGWILFRLGRVEEAIVELEQAAEGEDPDGVILEHLADAYAAAGRSDDANRYWERAVEAFEESDDEKMAKRVREKLAGQK